MSILILRRITKSKKYSWLTFIANDNFPTNYIATILCDRFDLQPTTWEAFLGVSGGVISWNVKGKCLSEIHTFKCEIIDEVVKLNYGILDGKFNIE